MKTRIVFGAIISSLVLSACAPKGRPTVDNSMARLGGCAGQQKTLPLSSISLQGGSEAAKSQAVMTSLSDDPSCAGVSNVEWSAPAAKILSEGATGIVSSYSQPGHYIVQAKLQSATSSAIVTQATTVVDNAPLLSGPQVGMIGMDLNYSVVVPVGLQVASVAWNFGDGEMGAGLSVTHQYDNPGDVSISAVVTLQSGVSYTLSQSVTVLFYYDNFECLPEARIFAPQSAEVGDSVVFALNVPNCLEGKISGVKWSFGDGGAAASGRSVSKTYQALGFYEVTAEVYSSLSYDGPLFVLKQPIRILEKSVDVPEPKCPTLGEQKYQYSNEVSSAESCGVDGKKEVIRHDKVVLECRYGDLVQDWIVISTNTEIKSEGVCQGQSCQLPDGSKLQNGGSKVMYSSSTPAGTCESVSETRSCSNGVLSGSATFSQLSCHAGCPGFGIHGSTQSGILVGEEKVALQCAYGEQGYFNLFNTVEDRSCSNGVVSSSSSRRGTLKTQGACPTYSFQSTGNYSACSQNCGGKQRLIHKCVDSEGRDSVANRCGNEPVVERACDGNPEAVRRQEISVSQDDSGSSASCPKNQIGIILKSREITTTRVFACIDHSVQLASETVTPGAWVEESYCRDYVAYRCSHDSLSNTEAHGRYEWMVKCQNQVPVLKEFLANFHDVTTSVAKGGIDSSSRVLYPTFMDASKKPEKFWIAPVKASASCTVPAKIYVVAVCVSSCATPEQSIAVGRKGQGLVQKTFIEALTEKTAKVMTLGSLKSVEAHDLVETSVDTWVTELFDTDHEIIEFKMASGGSLRLTKNHPLIAENGEMRVASDFKVGDALVKLGGVKDPIVAMKSVVHHGKVYNLFTTSSEPARNIVITGGYLNGTAFFQNEGASFQNTQVLRKRLIKGVFSK